MNPKEVESVEIYHKPANFFHFQCNVISFKGLKKASYKLELFCINDFILEGNSVHYLSFSDICLEASQVERVIGFNNDHTKLEITYEYEKSVSIPV